MTWPPRGPRTTHPYRAVITRTAPHADYPWDVSIDRVDPDTGRRNVDLDSIDYGSFATHADAIEFACSILAFANPR